MKFNICYLQTLTNSHSLTQCSGTHIGIASLFDHLLVRCFSYSSTPRCSSDKTLRQNWFQQAFRSFKSSFLISMFQHKKYISGCWRVFFPPSVWRLYGFLCFTLSPPPHLLSFLSSTHAVQLTVPAGDDSQLMSSSLRWPAYPMS